MWPLPYFLYGGIMSFCLRFKRDSKHLNTVDEIIIQYKQEHISIKNFLKEHQKQRIIIDCTNNVSLAIREILHLKYAEPSLDNYAVLLKYGDEDYKHFRAAGVPFFFDYHCNQWDDLYGLIEMGVSDIYITDGLGFELENVADVCNAFNVKIRVFCNVCQSTWKGTSTIHSFFIRPEDVDLYAHYVDVFEFFGELKTVTADMLYIIYSKDKKWFGPLKEIIVGFNSNLDSRYLSPNFAIKRVRCNRKCIKGGKCQTCFSIEHLSETLKDKGMYLIPVQEKLSEPFDN